MNVAVVILGALTLVAATAGVAAAVRTGVVRATRALRVHLRRRTRIGRRIGFGPVASAVVATAGAGAISLVVVPLRLGTLPFAPGTGTLESLFASASIAAGVGAGFGIHAATRRLFPHVEPVTPPALAGLKKASSR